MSKAILFITHTYKDIIMLNQLAAYFLKIFNMRPVTYGSELEQYIVSKRPQSTEEIDHWTRQFDQNQARNKGW